MEKYEEIYARIHSQTVRAACDDLLSYFHGRGDFSVKPMTSGPKKAVHFAWRSKDIYAFIANNYWLLWYFRKPGTKIGAFSFSAVQIAFPEADFTIRKDPNVREITTKITNKNEAASIIEFAHRHPPVT